MRHIVSVIALIGLSAACAPTITQADVVGGEEECTIHLSCGEDGCVGVKYTITCELNLTNDIYDCTCFADGQAGAAFSEAGVCTIEGGSFSHVDLADAADHAVKDCEFPVAVLTE